jgi:transcriptional regulator with XRE-family HTH domain
MARLSDFSDPVRDALVHGESAPAEFASWPVHECLRRLRLRFGLNRKQLAAKAGVSASLVGRAEKGADVRLSTLIKLYAALGCRLLALPAGALYELDRRQAHLDNDWLDWKRKNARYLSNPDSVSIHFTGPGDSGMNGNAISLAPGRSTTP